MLCWLDDHHFIQHNIRSNYKKVGKFEEDIDIFVFILFILNVRPSNVVTKDQTKYVKFNDCVVYFPSFTHLGEWDEKGNSV